MMSLVAAFIFSAGLIAQEKTEVSIQVKKDGKVVKDTTYQFDDAAEAKDVMKMVEVMSGVDADMEDMHYNYTTAHSGGKHANTMVFISKDGEKTEIREMHSDSLVWVSEGDGPHMEHMHGENVIVMKKGDDETIDIWVDKDGEDSEKKHIKVVVSGDEKGNWHAVTTDESDLDEDGEAENVKVIVIKKEIHEDVDHDVDHDHDHDEDEDHDEDVDVDVEVVKKKK